MRISDWSSDVCSSDLAGSRIQPVPGQTTQAHEHEATGSMIEFYPQIKLAHVFLALCSGAIFALRGAGVLANMRWPHLAPIRWTSYTVDTCLLTAALLLRSEENTSELQSLMRHT